MSTSLAAKSLPADLLPFAFEAARRAGRDFTTTAEELDAEPGLRDVASVDDFWIYVNDAGRIVLFAYRSGTAAEIVPHTTTEEITALGRRKPAFRERAEMGLAGTWWAAEACVEEIVNEKIAALKAAAAQG